MPVVILTYQFKTARAIAKVKALDHAHFFQHVHGAIDGGEVALFPALLHFQKNFPVRKGMKMFAEYFQDGRARAGDFARLAAQTVFQQGQILFSTRMRMGMIVQLSHASKVSRTN